MTNAAKEDLGHQQKPHLYLFARRQKRSSFYLTNRPSKPVNQVCDRLLKIRESYFSDETAHKPFLAHYDEKARFWYPSVSRNGVPMIYLS